MRSRLIQPRGLKCFVSVPAQYRRLSRLIQPRGLKSSAPIAAASVKVEAYTASWIEMLKSALSGSIGSVEAYTASWIEIPMLRDTPVLRESRLIQPRGLKLSALRHTPGNLQCRGLYSLVD